ncbi:Uncharacterized protein TCM_016152 [Theobroma cacao]|uniref:Uncharacterized protein n=1 Tax=Theobroma cacao TaxID=3641 RepID=A0A061G4U1_THECC|nr:Uncharacterized protein TCM_016152 [Theobroma cacao]
MVHSAGKKRFETTKMEIPMLVKQGTGQSQRRNSTRQILGLGSCSEISFRVWSLVYPAIIKLVVFWFPLQGWFTSSRESRPFIYLEHQQPRQGATALSTPPVSPKEVKESPSKLFTFHLTRNDRVQGSQSNEVLNSVSKKQFSISWQKSEESNGKCFKQKVHVICLYPVYCLAWSAFFQRGSITINLRVNDVEPKAVATLCSDDVSPI